MNSRIQKNTLIGRSLWMVAGVLLLFSIAARAAEQRPNVLFIAIDDMNDWVGCLGGHPQVKTPNIDGLAARGTLFTNGHAQAPLCNPSRTSIMSGLRPGSTGIYTLQPGFRASPVLKDYVMLPQYFRKNGYFTATSGKVYHDGSVPPRDRTNEFEVWGPAPSMPTPPKKIVNTPDTLKLMDWGVFPERDEDEADWKIADACIGQLKS